MQPLWRTVWRFLKKLEIELPYDPAIHTTEQYTFNIFFCVILNLILWHQKDGETAKITEARWHSLRRFGETFGKHFGGVLRIVHGLGKLICLGKLFDRMPS